MVKIENIKGLRKCAMCGHEAILRKNASKRFQVQCQGCKAHTAWTDKTSAIIDWYNTCDLYERANGRFDERGGNFTPSITITELNERITRAVKLFEDELLKGI